MRAHLPTSAMLGATLLWASSATASKLALIEATVLEMVAFRILGAALVMWTVVLVVRRKIPWRGPMPLIMGLLEPGLVTFFIALGVSLTSAVNASGSALALLRCAADLPDERPTPPNRVPWC